MNQTPLSLSHSHQFVSHNHHGEKRTFYVLLLTVTAMFAEIISGKIFGSMALLADGWHMGTHAAAFCITLFTYRYAKRHADNKDFSYGTGKVSVLGGFSSAIALGIVALMMLVESVERLVNPQTIQFNEAIFVAIIGLIVNFVSMILLHDHHHDHHKHEHNEHHHDTHQHEDHNLKAAYLHVLADTLTSVLAIIALVVGKYVGWNWLDALMGIVGALVISKWAIGLVRQTSPVLLDSEINQQYRNTIVDAISPHAEIIDLHVWKISANHHAATMIICSHGNKTVDEYRQILSQFDKIHHLTIELHNAT